MALINLMFIFLKVTTNYKKACAFFTGLTYPKSNSPLTFDNDGTGLKLFFCDLPTGFQAIPASSYSDPNQVMIVKWIMTLR